MTDDLKKAEQGSEKKDSGNIAVFKSECRQYQYYQTRIAALNERLQLLDLRMQNVYSPVLDKIGSTPTPHGLDYELIIKQKDDLRDVRKYYEQKIQWITDVIDDVPSPAYRLLIWLTYIQKEPLKKVSEDFGVPRQMIYKRRRDYLDQALSEERMQQLKKIERENAQYVAAGK